MPVALRDPALYLLILGYLGAGALLAALVLAGFSALLSFWAGWRESDLFVQVGRRAFYAATAMAVLAAIALETALLTHDFSLAYVAEHTDISTPVALVAAGFYSGQEGSLLYWTLILGLLGSASLVASGALGGRVAAYAAGILAAIITFFLFVLAVVASPFELLSVTAPDGLVFNPVLRDGGFLIHLPVVFARFVAFDPWFLGFLGACIAFSAVLLATRAALGGAPATRPAEPVSREGAFVLQNMFLIGVIAVVFWGTLLPLVSGMFGLERVVGAPYY